MNANLTDVAKEFASEFYSVEKVIEVWPKSQSAPAVIRLEALVSHHEDAPSYDVRAYVQWEPPQPLGSVIGDAWVAYDIPDILGADSIDNALKRALVFLLDGFRQKS